MFLQLPDDSSPLSSFLRGHYPPQEDYTFFEIVTLILNYIAAHGLQGKDNPGRFTMDAALSFLSPGDTHRDLSEIPGLVRDALQAHQSM